MKKGSLYRAGTPTDVLTYEHIEEVYKTIVLVGNNPLSDKPVIYPVSGKRLDEHKNQYEKQKDTLVSTPRTNH